MKRPPQADRVASVELLPSDLWYSTARLIEVALTAGATRNVVA
jgi:hypothetical protein